MNPFANRSFARRAPTTETLAPMAKGRAKVFADGIAPLPPSEKGEPLLLDALLYPNRSLPNTGFMVLMAIVIGVNITFGIAFTLQGAWPVLAFGGLDILLVYCAFKISYRQGRLHERLWIRAGNIHISRVLPSGHEMRWQLPAIFTDLVFPDPMEHEGQIVIRHKGKHLIVGAFLSPEERLAFAKRLREAMLSSRNASY